MAEYLTIARPYAKAAFEFARDSDAIAVWSKMLDFSAGLMEHKTVFELFHQQPYTVFAQHFMQACRDVFDVYGNNFLQVLIENQRLQILPAIRDTFHNYCYEHEQNGIAYVESAYELSPEQSQRITTQLHRRFGKNFTLQFKIDARLISGTRVKVGDEVMDSSIRTKLQRLEQQLQS